VYYAYMVEFRAELWLWALANSLPFILMGVWVEAGARGDFGMGELGFARYFLAVFLTRQLTVVWVIYEFERHVVSGELATRLIQPMDPVWRYVAGHLAERVARGPFVGLILVGFFACYPEAFWVPSAWEALAFLAAAAAAFALRFVMQYTHAMLGFWTERAHALEQLWFVVFLFFSGMLAPLDVYPEAVREVALWTPFPYLIYLPAQLLVGRPIDLGHAALVMALWGAGFFALNRWLWRRGLRSFSGMGA
jgi:ABC-2 type transport system permease protein